jgi:hypothetical protein
LNDRLQGEKRRPVKPSQQIVSPAGVIPENRQFNTQDSKNIRWSSQGNVYVRRRRLIEQSIHEATLNKQGVVVPPYQSFRSSYLDHKRYRPQVERLQLLL